MTHVYIIQMCYRYDGVGEVVSVHGTREGALKEVSRLCAEWVANHPGHRFLPSHSNGKAEIWWIAEHSRMGYMLFGLELK